MTGQSQFSRLLKQQRSSPPFVARREPAPVQKDGQRINEDIRVREVHLIDKDGANLGTIPIADALAKAAGGRPRPGRDFPQRRAAGLQDPRLWQVPLPGAEKAGRSPQEAEDRRGQGDQAPSDDRRPRLRREDELDAAASSRRATRSRSRCASAAARWPTRSSAPGCSSGSRTTPTRSPRSKSEPRMEGRQMVMMLAPR